MLVNCLYENEEELKTTYAFNILIENPKGIEKRCKNDVCQTIYSIWYVSGVSFQRNDQMLATSSQPNQNIFNTSNLAKYNIKKMSSAKLALGATGVFASYLINSILLQKIFTHQYPLSGKGKSGSHYFQHSDLVQLIASVFCLGYALISGLVQHQSKSPLPMREIVRLGVLYFINVSTLNYCLYYIPYPMRVVGDKLGYLSAVMVGVYFSRVGNKSKFRLGKEKLVIALMITVGTLLFSYFYKVNKKAEVLYNPDEMWIGFVLLATSVITQALFTDTQAYNKISYKPTMNHLLVAVNTVGIICSILMLTIQGQLKTSLDFCLTHKEISRDLLLYGTLSVAGQVSIYFIILNFKQHIFPLISTSRKVVTVLLSIYIYKHPTNVWMWLALVLVFGGLIYELADELYYDLTGQKPTKVEIHKQVEEEKDEVKEQ